MTIQGRKIPLADQAAEVKRELALRRAVYPGLIAKGRMSESAAQVHMARLIAVEATLEWLARNEPVFRALAREAAFITTHPAVSEIMAAFPGAEIVAIASEEDCT